MTQAIGPVSVPAALTPAAGSPAPVPAAPPGPLASGEQVRMSSIASPVRRKTLAEQLQEVGEVKEGSGFAAKVWNWMNKPKVEAAREFGGSILHNAPSLIIESSKHAAGGVAVAAGEAVAVGGVAVAGEVATAGSAAGKGVARALGAAGSSSIMAVLAKVGAVTGSVGGVVQLLRDLVKGRQGSERKVDQGLIISGGFLAATGSVIALCGGALPGAVIGLMGTLIHATGLLRKANMQDEDAIQAHFQSGIAEP